MSELPVAERWFRTQRVTDDITLLVEDHLDLFFESNVWHLRGRDRDLVVDAGNGIGDLRGELTPLTADRDVVAVATHHHFDHVGGLHEFDERWCHEDDADRIRDPDRLALLRVDYFPGLEEDIRWFGYEPPECVVTALPSEGFDLEGWRTQPAEPTRILVEGRRRRPGRSCLRGSSTSRGTRPDRSPCGTRRMACCSPATPRRSAIRSRPTTRRRSWRRCAGSGRCPSSCVRRPRTAVRSRGAGGADRRAARRARLRGGGRPQAKWRVNTASAFVHPFKPNRTISDRHEPAQPGARAPQQLKLPAPGDRCLDVRGSLGAERLVARAIDGLHLRVAVLEQRAGGSRPELELDRQRPPRRELRLVRDRPADPREHHVAVRRGRDIVRSVLRRHREGVRAHAVGDDRLVLDRPSHFVRPEPPGSSSHQ